MQMSYGPRGPTPNDQLNALTKPLPSGWATKVETLYNRVARAEQLDAQGLWFDAAQMLAAAVYLGDNPTADAFVKAVQFVLNEARARALGEV